ncbi:MAG: flagellar hook protein FlgE [Firmicutes bacterium]|nr:flagellar hook protein FlgE [Bacillota bacterium]
MMRALFSGVSGLQNHQLRMDVVANNIANVNTIGFKASRALFTEAMNQALRGASAPQQNRGGTNPAQVGLGVALASIDTILSPGNTQVTGENTDLAIQGNGYFVLDTGSGRVYTRAGAFKLDGNGYLVDAGTGDRVLGWQANGGVLPATNETNLAAIRIPADVTLAAQASTQVTFTGNLDASQPTGATRDLTVDVVDSLGQTHKLRITLTKSAANTWDWTVYDPSLNPIGNSGATPVVFDPTGKVQSGGTGTVTYAPGGGASSMTLNLDFSALTQYAQESTAIGSSDGYGAGSLVGFSVDPTGTITGIFSNSRKLVLGQVALATFTNPGGLQRAGGGMFQESANSGKADIGAPGTGTRGSIAPGSLEMSNVDLAQQFTDMITTERGFQANSRVITTADEMLQELANLKR